MIRLVQPGLIGHGLLPEVWSFLTMTVPAQSPKQTVDAMLSEAKIVQTPCGEGQMVWQVWGKPTQRPPLVLLHGGFGSWTHWIANVQRLAETRLVATCDMPGLGDSASAPGELTPDNLAKPIAAGLDNVIGANTPFDLTGFSFGGLIGSRVAQMVGERMLNYIAVGASGFEGLHVRVLGIRVPDADMSDDEKNQIHRENLQILMLHDAAKIDDLAIYTHRKNVARSRVRSRPMSLANHLVEALPGIKARLGGIWGVHDATGGGREEILKRHDIFKQHQPDARFAIIEDAGHWVMYEDPAGFEAVLLDMLDR
jgi:2-hydroxy-6-oxonona-2,4-dienedioate hydrolase